MANERFGMRCPKCCDCIYIGKTMGGGVYTNIDEAYAMDTIHDWMWDHLIDCYGKFDCFKDDDIVLFEVVTEGHHDVQNNILSNKHWGRHYKKETEPKGEHD